MRVLLKARQIEKLRRRTHIPVQLPQIPRSPAAHTAEKTEALHPASKAERKRSLSGWLEYEFAEPPEKETILSAKCISTSEFPHFNREAF